ncbi:septation protein SepH [Cellulomonas sp. KRMCY2]|uniref:septation protein SepH n=1 Tax=Cellulomonas sp. KRMCY2 TaxID=1304865 RepID=UPI00045E8894|nr:septation protein SepH [Cellulomonas sp. KRMCY2]
MSELRLVGLHDDGEHVVVEGSDGQRFRLPIDEALRAAVRRDRPQLEQVRAELTGVLAPREIQARIRAGASAQDVADDSGMPVEHIRRYDGPVLAEREFVAAQARATRIGRETGSPVLGDLVTDRLATRGVDAASIRWDAFRTGSAPWTVEVLFGIGGSERSARWSYEVATRSVHAVDDEARWLSETEIADEPIPRRHLAAVRSAVFDVELDAALRPLLASVDLPGPPGAAAEPEPEPHEATEALLDDLTGRRGVRQQLADAADDDDEAFEGFGPQHAFDFENPEVTTPVPGAHPPASRPDLAVDARVLSMPAGHRDRLHAVPTDGSASDETPQAVATLGATAAAEDDAGTSTVSAPRARTRKGRASVPSWDEIVFGAKPE